LPSERKVSSLGSGFVIDGNEGLVVTNNHVIDGADEIIISFHDGSKLKVDKVMGRDSKTDIALLKVTPKKPLVSVAFGSSGAMKVGDWVMAIGNPFDLGGSVTVGIISAKARDINAGPYDDFLQTDAAINKGNSGGPLFNMDGQVIGVNTAIISPTGGSIGIGFAVPADTVTGVVTQIKEFGEVRRGWLGVKIQSISEDIGESLGVPESMGALVAGVTPDSPAAKAGLEAGDVILKFDGKDVSTMRGLPKIVAQTPIGKTVEVEVLRQGQRKTLSAEDRPRRAQGGGEGRKGGAIGNAADGPFARASHRGACHEARLRPQGQGRARDGDRPGEPRRVQEHPRRRRDRRGPAGSGDKRRGHRKVDRQGSCHRRQDRAAPRRGFQGRHAVRRRAVLRYFAYRETAALPDIQVSAAPVFGDDDLRESHSLLDTITDSLAPVHRDGHKFIAIGLAVTLVLLWLWPAAGWLAALVTAWIIYFFRDPDRVTPLRDGLVVAPGDGRISQIEAVRPPAELGLGEEPRQRISIFLSVFDVHINRSPVAGRIARAIYVPGAFLNAALDKASEENERRALIIEMPSGGTIAVVQIAGLVARRIVAFSDEGDTVGIGERFGLIRFGSRVDTYLPPGVAPLVAVGQRAVGGETVLADLKSQEPERESRRS
jgi:phosphatidylserine decarboxylase precursor-related protein